jgi:hypothetical protein
VSQDLNGYLLNCWWFRVVVTGNVKKCARVSILKLFKHSTQVCFYISVGLAPNILHVQMVGRLDEPMSGSACVSEFSLIVIST